MQISKKERLLRVKTQEKKLILISKSYNFLPQKHTIKKSQLMRKIIPSLSKMWLKVINLEQSLFPKLEESMGHFKS